MRKCRKCKNDREPGDFPNYNGKPGYVCGGCKAARKGKKKKPKLTKEAAPPELLLEFPAGYGFSAKTEADAICIQQVSEDSDDTVWLSRAELATIIAHFGEWAGERAE